MPDVAGSVYTFSFWSVGDAATHSATVTEPSGPTAMWAFWPSAGAGTSAQVFCEGVILATTWLLAAGSQVATAAVPSAPIAARTNSGLPPLAIVNGAPNSSSFGPR